MVTVVEYLSAAVKGKPIDGTDVKTLEEARIELTRLRRVAYRVCDILNRTSSAAGNPALRPNKSVKDDKKKKRAAVAQEDSYKNYKKVAVAKTDGVRDLLKTAMQTNLLFKGCTMADLDDFADVFVPKKFAGGSTVIKQGDKGSTFYIVESGSLDIFINVGEGENATERSSPSHACHGCSRASSSAGTWRATASSPTPPSRRSSISCRRPPSRAPRSTLNKPS